MFKFLPYLLSALVAHRFQTRIALLCLTLSFAAAGATSSTARHTEGVMEAPEPNAAVDPVEGSAPYGWNLSEQQRPLLSLPDQVTPNIDLSLSYPMQQFLFPLFQSLYFNNHSGKYLLILIPRGGRRAELVDLVRNGKANTFSDVTTGLQLFDRNDLKIIRSRDETEYTFLRFADGEFRCSRVNNGRGQELTLRHANDNLIHDIVDSAGRTIRLNYQRGRFDSITQTWSANAVRLTRTWSTAEGNDVRRAHAGYALPTLPRIAKSVPRNATTSTYTSEMAESDRVLAKIFGDAGAVAAANGFEPMALAGQYPLYRGDVVGDDGRILRGHLSYAMHLYGSADGTGDSAIYIPTGFTSHSDEVSPTDAAVTFYYPRLGNLANVTLAVFHVANFRISNEGARVSIGNIGGAGGSSSIYKHSHIEFYRGNTHLPSASARQNLRIDPATVFAAKSVLAAVRGNIR